MNQELRQWAIEKAIAAGTDCYAVTKIAEDFLEFVMNEPVKSATPPGLFKRADYEAAFDAGLTPKQTAQKSGFTPRAASAHFNLIRRARGIPLAASGNPNFKRKNGAAHS